MKEQLAILLTTLKAKVHIALSVVGAFLLPLQGLLILIGLMIAIDTFTGVYKARKKKEKVTSRKLSNVISKMLLYQLTLLTFYILDVYLLGEFVSIFTSIPLFLTKLTAIILCSIEVVSINENFTAITGKSLWTQIKLILWRAKELNDDYKAVGLKPQDKAKPISDVTPTSDEEDKV
jgi:hypothetical protein